MILSVFFLFTIVAASFIFALQSRAFNKMVLVLFSLIQLWISGYAFFHLNQLDSSYFRFDGIGTVLSSLLSVIFIPGILHSFHYFQQKPCTKREESIYTLSLVFLCMCMQGAYFAEHMGILWACIEATTLSVTSLIYHERVSTSLEATWKYLFVSSIGITIAFTGILFLAMAASQAGLHSLNIREICQYSPLINSRWLSVSFLLIFTGYSAKIGLFPLHAAAIDAKTVTPYPVNALISTALVNVGFIGIFRIYSIAAGNPAFSFCGKVLMISGLLSIAIAAFHLLKVRQFKRLFAFSSLEHMGLVALALGAGKTGVYAAILHLILHSLAKAALFLQIGPVYRYFGTYQVEGTGNYIRINPAGSLVLIFALFSIAAIPPSGLFMTEFMICKVLFVKQHILIAGLALALISVIIFVLFRNLFHLIYAPYKGDLHPAESNVWENLLPLGFLFMALAIGLYQPEILKNLLVSAVDLFGGKTW